VRRALVLAFALGSACSQIFGLDPPKIIDGGTCAFRSVSASRAATCAVDGAGAVWCWGANSGGQVQPEADHAVPVVMPNRLALPTAAVQVAVGNVFTCARLEDGSVWCWGDNARGTLGNGTTAAQTAPVQVQLGGDAAVDLDVGASHACVRLASNGAVACWGDNTALDLGQPLSVTTQAVPSVVAGTEGALALAVGHRHACALDASGSVVCWGRNRDGQLGPATGSASATPQMIPSLGAVTALGASGRESCAIEQLGDVRCWGANESGELGDGTYNSTSTPGAAAVAGAAEVHAGAYGACARLLDGTVQCWGSLDAGDGQLVISSNPRAAMVTGAVAMSVKFNHTCISTGDHLLCWGSNQEGELGRGVRSITPSPVAVSLPGSVSAAAVAAQRACAVVGGRLFCWGQGGLGKGDANGSVAPIETATAVLGTSVVGVSLSSYNTGCAWTAAGKAYCWGNNSQGQLGTGTTSSYESTPQPVMLIAQVAQMAQGDNHTCAVTSNGPLFCWGGNDSYQLGDGTNVSRAQPQQVPNINNVQKVVAGSTYTCAIGGSTLKCWGANYAGQLGDGTTTSRAMGIQPAIPSGGGVLDVAIGRDDTCAVTGAGLVYCWGDNSFGQLGLGDYASRTSPTQVALPGIATAVFAGLEMTCAALTDGSVYCWGSDHMGQFGDGMTVDSPVPRLVSSLAGLTPVLGGNGTCAIGSSGALSCWGVDIVTGRDPVGVSIPMQAKLSCQ
jgi:alpha-tubulin suppressor-like RCC1 family protein